MKKNSIVYTAVLSLLLCPLSGCGTAQHLAVHAEEEPDQSSSGISGYIVYYLVKDSDKWKNTTASVDKTKAVPEKLKKGSTYEICVCGYTDTSEEAEEYWGIEAEYLGKKSDIRTVVCK